MKFKVLYTKNGIGYLTEKESHFELDYIEIRQKENRVLTDNEVLQLPKTTSTNPNKKEWQLREKSTKRIVDYISTKKRNLSILDIGCGNGWFTNHLSLLSETIEVTGLDVNSEELEQAVRLFDSPNIDFLYGDIFKLRSHFKGQFDIIILNASVQYFSNFETLFIVLKSYLKPKGEIHIIDSPFYKKEQIINAKKRTVNYYTQMGFPRMAANYFHHEVSLINDFQVFHQYNRSYLDKFLSKNDSPFPWLCYKKIE